MIGEVRPTIRKAADALTGGVDTGQGRWKSTAYRICYTSVLVHTVLVHARHATARRGSLVRSVLIVNFTLEHPGARRRQSRVLSTEMAPAIELMSRLKGRAARRFGRPKRRPFIIKGRLTRAPVTKTATCFVAQVLALAESFGSRRCCVSDTLVPIPRGTPATNRGGTNRPTPRVQALKIARLRATTFAATPVDPRK
jgi:hypothetical protein